MINKTARISSILFIFASLLLDASLAFPTSGTLGSFLAASPFGRVRGLYQSIKLQETNSTEDDGEDDDYYDNGTAVDLGDDEDDDADFPSMSPVVDSSPAPSVQVTTDNNPLTFTPTVTPTKSPTKYKSPKPSLPITSNPTKSPTMAPTTESWSNKIKDEQEKLKELANDRTAEVLAGIFVFLGISGMLFTAYQFLERPDGLCVSCCRLSLKVVTFLLKILCLPCRICFGRYTGYTGSDPRNRTVFVEEYTNDLELT